MRVRCGCVLTAAGVCYPQVFLQDAAMLYAEYSTKCSVYQGAVFQHPDWEPYMKQVQYMHVMRALRLPLTLWCHHTRIGSCSRRCC